MTAGSTYSAYSRVAFGIALCLKLGGTARAGPPDAGDFDRDGPGIAEVLAGWPVAQGRVTEVKAVPGQSDENGRVWESTWVITRVYCGTGARAGDTFRATTAEGIPRMLLGNRIGSVPFLAPRVGDTGVWQLYRTADGKGISGNWSPGAMRLAPPGPHPRAPGDATRDPVLAVHLPLPFLGHEGDSPPAEAAGAVKAGAALHALAAAKGEPERLRLLGEQMRGGDPYVAATGLCVLQEATGVEGRAALARELLPDARVPVRVRVVLDRLLCGWQEPDWAASPQRQQAMLRLAADARDADDFGELGAWLYLGADHGTFTTHQCLEVFKASLRNDRLLSSCGELYTMVHFALVRRSAAERDEMFDYFLGLIRAPGQDVKVRRAAAGAFGYVGQSQPPLTPRQLALIREVRATERDDEALQALGQALGETGRRTNAPRPAR